VAGDCPPTLGGEPGSLFDQTPSRLRLRAEADWLIFEGEVLDGSAVEFHEEAERRGFCRLLTYEPSFCDPACDAAEVCIGGACRAYPSRLAIGTLELTSVAAEHIAVEPSPLQHYDWMTEELGVTDVQAFGVFAPAAAGGPLELETCVVLPPDPTQNWTDLVAARAPDEDLTLSWSNPIATARIYLRMTTGIGTHGGISPVKIECEGPDQGTLTIPGTYLDSLYAQGWSCGESGSNQLTRYHAVESAAEAGTIQLRTDSSASFWHIP